MLVSSGIPASIYWTGGLLVLIVLVHRLLYGSATRPLPPGPKPLPVIGNLHQLPTSLQFFEFCKWSKEYGPVMYLNMAGQHFVVLSSDQAAQDLLTRRGAQYSDRPRRVMCGELVTKGMHMLLRPYDAAYRLHQRMEAPLLNVRAARCYQHLQDIECKQTLIDILKASDSAGGEGIDLHHHFERAMGSFIYSIAYGYRLKTGFEQQFEDAKRVQHEFARTGVVGAYIVDSFPTLNYLPKFLAPWKKEGEELYQLEHNLHMGNLEKALQNPGWNWTKHYINSCVEAQGMPRVEVAFDLGIMTDAALDTSTVALDWFTVAWITCGHKGWVAKAQALLDEVVGQRLPQFEDRDKLVYIDAISEFDMERKHDSGKAMLTGDLVNETLRWRPIVVGGVPHATKTEDEYMGCRIPAGSIVLANHFAIARDESVFGPQADEFIPERWISDEGDLKDLPQTGFGFGRRICTGRHIARNQLFIQAARILWAFNLDTGISKETGKKEVVDDMAGLEGFVRSPKLYKIVCTPRALWVRCQIEAQGNTHDIDYSKVLDQASKDRKVKIEKAR